MRAVSGTAPLPPGVQRRKQLRQERRADRLRHLWRLTVYSALSAGLAYLLLREGWSLRQPAQVEVIGSSMVSRDQIIKAAALRFPLPLLNLNPNELSQTLAGALPVEQVKVSRLMLPPRLRVELTDRKAVARAERRTPQGVEQGHVDQLGNWISFPQDQSFNLRKDEPGLRVVGWNERHRPTLIQLFEKIDRIGPGLTEIRFDPDGTLWLVTRELGGLKLGSSAALLDRQIQVVEHLSRNLPEQVKRRRPQLIDLSDPEQPELSLPTAVAPPVRAGQPKPEASTSPAAQ